MFKIIMITAVILALNQLSEAIPKPTSVGDSCTPGKESYDCEFIGSYYGFCHFRTKTCKKNYNGCSMTAEQIGCMSVQALLPTLQGVSCSDGDKACNDGFQATIKTAETACNIALSVICDDANCPQNHYNRICTNLKRTGQGKWKLN